ncbi:MAG: electron transfer flavoprotein subunit beta/FixA family protein [Chloroflexota bacterium]|nr:electron transfer flavoprotein subunit beta/FixA family protein [Chloroflexota bacterium]
MSDQTDQISIAVLVKQVPDVNAITVDAVTNRAHLGSTQVMNTYDAYAVGEAIGIKERVGATVTVITAGPPSSTQVLLRALATGADEAILIDLPNHNDLDTLETARILAGEIRKNGFDLVLAGQSTDDYETGQVGPQVAELLGWPHTSLVTHVEIAAGRTLSINRDAEASKEVVETTMPAVLMVLSGRDGSQKFPTLRGMMAAKKKTIPVVEAEPRRESPRLEWSDPVAIEREVAGTIIEGVPAEQAAAELVSWLREQKLV